ncbi:MULTISPECIES: efflux RND transporter periplasmic adaptor subunit [unclassified Pseudodesulfovibrio]|uniref:efflux RND transporter periplasmic adaptor subunit n=1 Tax=unclassified Pseudodesulfovibrio TaxID=2661612 RepID=UPI000FEB822E|nr:MULTISPECIES: efflux RND transporter periplasmic adaptor subunit [unclassified Pseudodesulfovibrio]MCJ2163315.1 efflux RND transporter periplasmic adaptor subunit [Pseudodesulfovibrio sp. S3-i]RWU06867.1 efflux RND transporter periplasmic adaptor subunit [Pseudodesulfovibrio sp. S3]
MVNPALRSVTALCLILSVSLMLAGCSGDDKKADQAAQQGPVPMKVVKAEARDMPLWGEFVGQISAHETVEVRARVGGFLVERKFEEGRHVTKGDLLFVIDPKPFQEDLKQAQSGLEYNQALYEKALKDFERFKKLYDEGVVSRDEYEGYQTQVSTYKAQISDNRAKVENAKIQLGYTKIYSPINGTIGRVQVDVGNLVGQGENTLLATISTQDPIYVSFSVSESDYIRAVRDKAAQTDRLIKLILSDGSEYDQPGKFDMVDPTIDPQTGTLGIRVLFPNPDDLLKPGQYAKVRVLLSNVKDAIVVPVKGVIDTQGMKSLYVVGEDGIIKSQPVKLGSEQGEFVMVTEGLNVGDMVIVDGARRVKPGMQIKPIVVPMSSDQSQPASAESSSAAPASGDATTKAE